MAVTASIGSTNTEAAAMIRQARLGEGPNPLRQAVAGMFRGVRATDRQGGQPGQTLSSMPVSVMVSDVQTSCRGRLTRRWVNRPRRSLLASFVVSLPRTLIAGSDSGWITLGAGLAVLEAVDDALESSGARRLPTPGVDGPIALKWPNDLVCGGLKLAGILTELARVEGDEAAVVIGVGMNLFMNQECLSGLPATSLHALYGPLPGFDLLRDRLTAGIMLRLSRRLEALSRDAAPERIRLRRRIASVCWTLGRPVEARLAAGGRVTGTAVAINPDASLAIRPVGASGPASHGGIRVVRTGDVGVLPQAAASCAAAPSADREMRA